MWQITDRELRQIEAALEYKPPSIRNCTKQYKKQIEAAASTLLDYGKHLAESCTTNSSGGKLRHFISFWKGTAPPYPVQLHALMQSQLVLRGLPCKVNFSIFGHDNNLWFAGFSKTYSHHSLALYIKFAGWLSVLSKLQRFSISTQRY